MRSFVLLSLAAVSLAACDSPYGPTKQYVSQKDYVTTGSHLPPGQANAGSGNVLVGSGDAIGNATTVRNGSKVGFGGS